MKRRPAPVRRVRGALLLLSLLAVSRPSPGHDLWLVPGAYRVRADETTRVFINNGDVFPESLTLLSQRRVAEVRVRGPEGDKAVTEFRADGKSLTFDYRSSTPGVHVLGLGSRPRRVRLKGEDFEDYLAKEGLDAIRKAREARGETLQPAVERYAKWAKAVVDVGEVQDSGAMPWSEPLGHRLEIVPLDHPNRVEPGGKLALRVLFEGEPIAGVPVRGGRVSGPGDAISETTDERGEAVVPIGAPGRWFVKAIHMIELEADPEVWWDSFWCTLSFEIWPGRGEPR